jgi:hypothetical protein
MRRLKRFCASATIGAMLLAATAGSARAQTISIRSITANEPDLGDIAAAAAGDTVFNIDAATGAVTRLGGNGRRLDNGLTRARVTVRCSGTNTECNSTPVRVRVNATGSSQGRAKPLTNLNVASGSATIRSVPTPGDAIEFVLEPLGRNTNRTFWIGADFTVRGDNSGMPTGPAAARFTVRVAPDPQAPGGPGKTGTAVANVRRAASIAKLSDLQFGAIVRPTTGNGAVTIAAASGERTVSGAGAYAMPTPLPTTATFAISGEGGRVLSIDMPNRIFLTHAGGSDPLRVNLDSTAGRNLTLSGSPGQGGSGQLGVGGSFNFNKNTPTGNYIGMFTVTVQYN